MRYCCNYYLAWIQKHRTEVFACSMFLVLSKAPFVTRRTLVSFAAVIRVERCVTNIRVVTVWPGYPDSLISSSSPISWLGNMDNADLEKLSISPGKLTPKFHPNTTEYSVTLGSDVKQIKINPLTSDSGASYSISVCRLLLYSRQMFSSAQFYILQTFTHSFVYAG